MLFANVDDLADVIRVVRADVRKHLGGLFQFCFIGGFHPFFELTHDLIELLDDFVPFLGIELVEGFVVITAEFLGFFAFQNLEIPAIPEHQMVRQLSDRVIALAVGPACLLGRQTLQGNIRRHKPLFGAVRRLQFRQQNLFERRWFLVLRRDGNGQQQKQKKTVLV